MSTSGSPLKTQDVRPQLEEEDSSLNGQTGQMSAGANIATEDPYASPSQSMRISLLSLGEGDEAPQSSSSPLQNMRKSRSQSPRRRTGHPHSYSRFSSPRSPRSPGSPGSPGTPRSPSLSSSLSSPGRYTGQRNAKGKKHGFGTYTHESGSTFVGEYVNGQRHGYGTYHYCNGNRYEGEFRANLKSGLGVMFYADTGERLEGTWRDDKVNGNGRFYYANGDVFEGIYVDGEKRGKGVLIYDNVKTGERTRRELEFHDPKLKYPVFVK